MLVPTYDLKTDSINVLLRCEDCGSIYYRDPLEQLADFHGINDLVCPLCSELEIMND